MDYLNNTLLFLTQENAELKERLRRMTDLTQLVQQQRTDQRKDCIAELHHQEITVIREMAQAHELQLRQELKHLNKEIKEAHAQLQQEMENALICKQTLALAQHDNEQLRRENQQLREEQERGQERVARLEEEMQQLQQRLEEQFRLREQEIMQKYVNRLEEAQDKHDQEIANRNKFAKFLEGKLNNAENEKEAIEAQLQSALATLDKQQRRQQAHHQHNQLAAAHYQQLATQLQTALLELEQEHQQLQQRLAEEERRRVGTEGEVREARERVREVERARCREVEREKSRVKSACEELHAHKKLLKAQAEREKRKEREFNHSKKILIHRIKEIGTPDSLHRTTSKTRRTDTCQSVSLDRSRDSPFVSSFLQERRSRDIATTATRPLKLNDLDTPTFESAQRKTIKIRK